MSDLARMIDDSPLLKMLGEALKSVPGALGKVASAGAGLATEAASSVGSAFAKVTETFMGSSHSAPSMSQEVARGQTPGIVPEHHAKSSFDVPIADLGGLSAPTFSSGGLSQGGVGRG